jgi:ACS family glucarate transporter-like MFS transporter
MKKRHAVLGLLALLSVITYLDRVCISVAGPRMQDDLGISPVQWGWVLSMFLVSYGLFEIPSGVMGDLFGQRKVLTRIVLWWSAFTALTGMAASYGSLLVIRFLFGAGEAGAYPNMTGTIGRWFPPLERARAQGVIWSASRIGGALSPLLIVPLMARIGWHGTFYVCGALGLVWAAAWLACYRDPAPAAGPDGEPEAARPRLPWGKLLRSRQLWLIMAMYWCYVWGSVFYLSWFPTYLVKGRGFSEAQMGLFASAPFVLGFFGNILGGYLSDWMVRKHGLSLGRRLIGTPCLLGAAFFILLTALTVGKRAGILSLALGFGVMDCMLPSAWSLCVDIGGRYSGAVSGAMNTAGSAGGFVCAVAFGYLVKIFGNYNAPLFVIAGMVTAAAVLFWQIDPTKPIFD